MSNWLSVWNSGMFWNSGGGEFRIACTTSSEVTVMPRRLYSASSIRLSIICSQTWSSIWVRSSSVSEAGMSRCRLSMVCCT